MGVEFALLFVGVVGNKVLDGVETVTTFEITGSHATRKLYGIKPPCGGAYLQSVESFSKLFGTLFCAMNALSLLL